MGRSGVDAPHTGSGSTRVDPGHRDNDSTMADLPQLTRLDKHEFDVALERAWKKHRSNSSGHVADYIPELTRVDPEKFGLAIASVHGRLHTIGDADAVFTIQSTSKPLTFCLALELAGPELVASRVGIEPSGDPFNAIVFDPDTHRPFNPMVNAGAIAIAGLLCEQLGRDAFDAVLEVLSAQQDSDPELGFVLMNQLPRVGEMGQIIAYSEEKLAVPLLAFLRARAADLPDLDLAATTFLLTHTLKPARLAATTRSATRPMRARSATEEPPYFCTTTFMARIL